jgi:hypothetical protein
MAPTTARTKSEMATVASMVMMLPLLPLPPPTTSTRRRRTKDDKFDVNNLDVDDNDLTTMMG